MRRTRFEIQIGHLLSKWLWANIPNRRALWFPHLWNVDDTVPLGVVVTCDPLHRGCTVNVRSLNPSSVGPPSIQPAPPWPAPPTVNRMHQALGDSNLTPAWAGNSGCLSSLFHFSFSNTRPTPEFLLFFLLESPSSSSLPRSQVDDLRARSPAVLPGLHLLKGSHPNIPGFGISASGPLAGLLG